MGTVKEELESQVIKLAEKSRGTIWDTTINKEGLANKVLTDQLSIKVNPALHCLLPDNTKEPVITQCSRIIGNLQIVCLITSNNIAIVLFFYREKSKEKSQIVGEGKYAIGPFSSTLYECIREKMVGSCQILVWTTPTSVYTVNCHQ